MKHKSNQSPGSDYALAYSTDPQKGKTAPATVKAAPPEQKHLHTALNTCKPVIRLERKGRGGKSVTIIEKLPAHETLINDLCAFLKRALGTGGTSYINEGTGVIEIQGERAETIPDLLAKYARP